MFAMILVLTNVVYPVMLFSLRINVSFLHMLSYCLRLVFYLVLMNCLLCLNDSNPEWCILDVGRLCPFSLSVDSTAVQTCCPNLQLSKLAAQTSLILATIVSLFFHLLFCTVSIYYLTDCIGIESCGNLFFFPCIASL
jgi:hypothetical protein